MKEISVSDVKTAICIFIPPRYPTYPAYPSRSSLGVAFFIWWLLKDKRTRKQTIRIINNLTSEEIEAYLARWKLERSIEDENR